MGLRLPRVAAWTDTTALRSDAPSLSRKSRRRSSRSNSGARYMIAASVAAGVFPTVFTFPRTCA